MPSCTTKSVYAADDLEEYVYNDSKICSNTCQSKYYYMNGDSKECRSSSECLSFSSNGDDDMVLCVDSCTWSDQAGTRDQSNTTPWV